MIQYLLCLFRIKTTAKKRPVDKILECQKMLPFRISSTADVVYNFLPCSYNVTENVTQVQQEDCDAWCIYQSPYQTNFRFWKKNKIPSSIEIKKFTIQTKGNIENKRFFTNFTLSSKTVRYNIHMYEELPRHIEAMWTSLWPIMMWPRCAQNSEVNWIT